MRVIKSQKEIKEITIKILILVEKDSKYLNKLSLASLNL